MNIDFTLQIGANFAGQGQLNQVQLQQIYNNASLDDQNDDNLQESFAGNVDIVRDHDFLDAFVGLNIVSDTYNQSAKTCSSESRLKEDDCKLIHQISGQSTFTDIVNQINENLTKSAFEQACNFDDADSDHWKML